MTPRPYLSYSQLMLFERSPEKYAEIYLAGERSFYSESMHLGKQTADALESDEMTGDAPMDLIIAQIPKLEVPEMEVKTHIKYDRNKFVPLFSKIDQAKKDLSDFIEVKTGKNKWTQGKVDRDDQITFYSMMCWLMTNKIPTARLVWAKTKRDLESGRPEFTGEIFTFHTQRHMGEILRMMTRCKRAWEGIQKLTEKTLV